MKKKIDGELNKEWIAKLRDFVKRYSEKPKTTAEETTIKDEKRRTQKTRTPPSLRKTIC